MDDLHRMDAEGPTWAGLRALYEAPDLPVEWRQARSRMLDLLENQTSVGSDWTLPDVATRAPDFATRAASPDDDAEWAVAVRWLATRPVEQALGFKGRYGNQNTATKLRSAFTRDTVLTELALDEADLDAARADVLAAPGDGTPAAGTAG